MQRYDGTDPFRAGADVRPTDPSKRAQQKMIDPPIGSLVGKTNSRFGLVVLAARRARQINAYFNQLGEGLGGYVPPQVHSFSRKPLSIALEEIEGDKVLIAPADAD